MMDYLKLFLIVNLLFVYSSPQTCAQSQYFNGQRCAPCQSNCKCSSQNTCTSCLSGFTYDSSFKNCLPCPSSTSSLNVGCGECCSQILSTQYVCSSCPSLTNTFLLGGQCLRLIGCASALNNGRCQKCSQNYFLYQGKCVSCDPSCRTCIDSSFCLTCASGYFNATNANLGVCSSCSIGCSSCTSLSICTTCTTAYRLSGSACVACSSNCLQCSATACVSCSSGYALSAGVCVACTVNGGTGCLSCSTLNGNIACTSCADSYYLSTSGICLSCTSKFPNSILCTFDKPVQCLNDYVTTLANRYYLINNQCVRNINRCKIMKNAQGQCSSCYFQASAYYSLNNNVCTLCSQSGCATYSTSCSCLGCQAGYQFVNSQCVACQILHCSQCQASLQLCQVCASGYGLASSACVSCSQTACLNCDGDATACLKCQSGYYVSSGTCYSCQASCLTCSSSILCTSCATGYFLLANGRCRQLPTNCLKVNSSGKCTKCSYGYMTFLGNCVPCSSTLYNLDQCERHCPSYYSLLKSEFIYSVFFFIMFLMTFLLQ